MKKILNHLRSDWYKYVIELIVITAGILGAYALNNWNEGRKESIKEQQILLQLKEDFNLNLVQLDQKIVHRTKMIRAANTLLEYVTDPSSMETDSLTKHISILIGSPTFKPIENNLINSGDILLIQNKKLKQRLTSWPSEMTALQEVERMWSEKMLNSVVPLLSDAGLLREGLRLWWGDGDNLKWILEGEADNPFQETGSAMNLGTPAVSRSELDGIASFAISFNYSANLQSQALRKRVLVIRELIEEEIED